jgi:hypothetical protein
MRTHSRRCSRRIAGTSRLARKALLVALSLTLAIDALAARPGAREFKWDELQKQGRISAGTVMPPESGSSGHRLRIESNQAGRSSVTVLTIERPQVGALRYRLSGQLRYDNVEGTGYLEMWSHFPDGGRYFSRTLAEEGPMMKLDGTSGWRSFVLPFDATGASYPPQLLVINVVLPGRGTVYLGPLELSEETGADAGTLGRFAGMAGGIAGAVVGCIGALIGVLTSLGRARRFVIVTAISLIALGALTFIAGIAAYGAIWPGSAFYPLLLLFGFLTAVVPLSLLPVIRKRYEEIELRAMRAHDVG